MIIIRDHNKEITDKVKNFLKANDIAYDESEHAWSYVCEEEVSFYVSNMECDDKTEELVCEHEEEIIQEASSKLKDCEYTIQQFMESVEYTIEKTIEKYKKQSNA